MINKYKYQDIAATNILKEMSESKYIASVLAACPGAGKTTISHIVINKYIQQNPNARILVLTEGQVTLAEQYISELDAPNVKINFTYGPIGQDVQVQVGIPQNINKLVGNIDVIIVDECHNWYFGTTVQNIIKNLKPKALMLMTGTPSQFTKHNQAIDNDFLGLIKDKRKYGMNYISAEDLIQNGVFSPVVLDVAKVTNKKNATVAISTTLQHAKREGYDLRKLMIACPSIKFAEEVKSYLKAMGRKVSLSTSENDAEGREIKEFKAGKTDVLIVVQRGLLGFNEKSITTLIDLRSTYNLNASMQLFARVLRTHPENITKSYIRIGDNKNFNRQIETTHKLKGLMYKDIFQGFNGSNIEITRW